MFHKCSTNCWSAAAERVNAVITFSPLAVRKWSETADLVALGVG